MSDVHERTVARFAFWSSVVVLEALQVDAVHGGGSVEVERIGLSLEGYVGRFSVDESVETRVPALRTLVAGGGCLAEIAGEVGVAIEGDGYFVGVCGVCVFAVDVAFPRDKSTLSHHRSGVRYVINAK